MYRSGKDYDEQYADYTRDIPMMVELATEYAGGKPILEMACGTLRVTIPIITSGIEVVGVDLSSSMIDRGWSKLFHSSDKVLSRLQTHIGDMRDFESPLMGEHNLALVPFTAFQHLLTTEAQVETLKNISRNLGKGGYLMADLFNPNVEQLSLGLKPHAPIVEKQVKLEGERTLVRARVTKYHSSTQLLEWTFFTKVFNAEGEPEKEYMETASLAVIFPNQWRMLLSSAGFEIVQEWGDHQRGKFYDGSPRMLFLARKSD